MVTKNRVDLSDLDFRPIPGEDDYEVVPIYNDERFRRQGAVGPYDMDAAQFQVADEYDGVPMGALGAKDTSYYIRVGLNQMLPPVWQKLQLIVEIQRRIETLLRANGYGLLYLHRAGIKDGGESWFWRDKFAWAKTEPGVDGLGFGLPRSLLKATKAKKQAAFDADPNPWGFTLGEAPADQVQNQEMVLIQNVDIKEIAKQAAIQAIPGIGIISSLVKSLTGMFSSRRQAKAGLHIEKWLDWLNLEEFNDLIPRASASFVTAGGSLPGENDFPPSAYVDSEYGKPSSKKWVAYNMGWEATPDVYTIDWLKERLRASIAPLNVIADRKAKAIAEAERLAQAKAELSLPEEVEKLGEIVQDAVDGGTISEDEAGTAVTALHKITTQEALTPDEQVVLSKLTPALKKSSIWSKLLPVAVTAAAVFLR